MACGALRSTLQSVCEALSVDTPPLHASQQTEDRSFLWVWGIAGKFGDRFVGDRSAVSFSKHPLPAGDICTFPTKTKYNPKNMVHQLLRRENAVVQMSMNVLTFGDFGVYGAVRGR